MSSYIMKHDQTHVTSKVASYLLDYQDCSEFLLPSSQWNVMYFEFSGTFSKFNVLVTQNRGSLEDERPNPMSAVV